MSTVQEILSAMDRLTPEELCVVKIGLESRLDDEDDPALLVVLEEAVAHADAHPSTGKSIEEVRAMIPKWISGSESLSAET